MSRRVNKRGLPLNTNIASLPDGNVALMKPRSYHCELSAIAVTAAPTQPPVQDSALKAWYGVAVNQVAGQQALLKRVPQ